MYINVGETGHVRLTVDFVIIVAKLHKLEVEPSLFVGLFDY